MDQVELGKRIRQRRKAQGLQQDDLAAALSVSRSMVSLYENGKVPITTNALHKAAEVLKVPVAYLIGDIDYDELIRMEAPERVEVQSITRIHDSSRFALKKKWMKDRINFMLDGIPDHLMDVAVEIIEVLTVHTYDKDRSNIWRRKVSEADVRNDDTDPYMIQDDPYTNG